MALLTPEQLRQKLAGANPAAPVNQNTGASTSITSPSVSNSLYPKSTPNFNQQVADRMIGNLNEGYKNDPNLFSNRDAYNSAYSYSNRTNDYEKQVLDNFWNQKNVTPTGPTPNPATVTNPNNINRPVKSNYGQFDPGFDLAANEQNVSAVYNDAFNTFQTPEQAKQRESIINEWLNTYSQPSNFEAQYKQERANSGIDTIDQNILMNTQKIWDASEGIRQIGQSFDTRQNQASAGMSNAFRASQMSQMSEPMNNVIARLNESGQLMNIDRSQRLDQLNSVMDFKKQDRQNLLDSYTKRLDLLANYLTPEQKTITLAKAQARINSLNNKDQLAIDNYKKSLDQKTKEEDALRTSGYDPNAISPEKRSQVLATAMQVANIVAEAKKVAPNLNIQRTNAQITADIVKLTEQYVAQGMDRASAQAKAIQDNLVNPLQGKGEYQQGLTTAEQIYKMPVTAQNDARAYQQWNMKNEEAKMIQDRLQNEIDNAAKAQQNATQDAYTKAQTQNLIEDNKRADQKQIDDKLQWEIENAWKSTSTDTIETVKRQIESGMAPEDLLTSIDNDTKRTLLKEIISKVVPDYKAKGTLPLSAKEIQTTSALFQAAADKDDNINSYNKVKEANYIAQDVLKKMATSKDGSPEYQNLITTLVGKVTDPTTWVLQGEYQAIASSMGSLFDRLEGGLYRIKNWGIWMTPEQMKKVISVIKSVHDSRKKTATDAVKRIAWLESVKYKVLGKQESAKKYIAESALQYGVNILEDEDKKLIQDALANKSSIQAPAAQTPVAPTTPAVSTTKRVINNLDPTGGYIANPKSMEDVSTNLRLANKSKSEAAVGWFIDQWNKIQSKYKIYKINGKIVYNDPKLGPTALTPDQTYGVQGLLNRYLKLIEEGVSSGKPVQLKIDPIN